MQDVDSHRDGWFRMVHGEVMGRGMSQSGVFAGAARILDPSTANVLALSDRPQGSDGFMSTLAECDV